MSAPTPLRVRLPFRSEDEFAASYGAHVGRDGFFLATKAPKPVGASLLFDLILADGTSILRGEGVVVRSNAGGERPGMTLRFVRLEATGKALVERIVSGRPARGSAPAEAQAHPSAWAAPSGPSAVAGSPSREMLARPAHREAWAPPAGPARVQPPTPFHPLPAARAEPEPEEVSADEVSDATSGETPEELAPGLGPTPVPGTLLAPEEPVIPAAAASEAVSAPGETAPAEEAEATSKVSDTFEPASAAADEAEAPSKVSGTFEPASAAAAESPEVPSTVSGTFEPASAAAESPEVPSKVSGTFEPASADAGEVEAPSSVSGTSEAAAPEEGAPRMEDTPLLEDTTLEALSKVSGTPEAAAPEERASSMEDTPPLEGTTLEAWAAARHGHGSSPRAPARAKGPEGAAVPEDAAGTGSEATASSASSAAAGEPPSTEHRTGTTGPHPPLDEVEVPELVVTEFKGPGPLRKPAGLEQTRASADVHAAITPPAGTLIVTPLDEPPPEPPERFKLEAPVRGDEPLHVPESSFHDVGEALKQPGATQERPTTPIPLLPSMETAAPDEMPVPPPPPLDEAPILEEGAIRLEPTPDVPKSEAPPAPSPLTLVPPALEAREAETPGPVEARSDEETPSPVAPAETRTAPVGTTELGIEINAESVRASWFHDGRAEPLVLDAVGGRHEVPVRLVREPGAPPRMLAPDAPEVPLWVGAPLPFLGTPAGSDTARTVARRWPAQVVPDDRGEAAFALEGGTVGAGELLATLLRWIRHRAEEITSHQAARVVLTVPVAFNTVQRERLREAAERAGFEGVRLVQAPTAATMAFAHGRGLARRRILVFRMGASTCDIAVLAASGNDLDMVACGGDGSLGAANFDEQIALALDKSARADGAVLRRRISEAGLLRTQLEDATLKEGIIDGSRLSRPDLEARTTALVERGVLLAREVLRSASLTPDSLDELVLVGSATRLPHVRRMIEDAMGRYARTDVDPGSAVSTGAAALAHLLNTAGPKSASRTALHEVLGVPLEIIAPELGQVRVLDRNTRLPAEKTLTLTLALGAPLEVQVFQGPAKAPDPRSFLGLLRAPADRAGDWLLHLSLDTDGVLRAAATNPSGKRQPLQLQMPAPSTESETPPPQRVPSEPETPAVPPKAETGVLGGLKKLFGRR